MTVCPFDLCASTSARRLLQNDQQREDFGENRDAFEQEQRKVHRAGDLRGRARLAADGFGSSGREASDAETGAENDEAQSETGAHERNCITFHCFSLPRKGTPLRRSGRSVLSDEREWPCR